MTDSLDWPDRLRNDSELGEALELQWLDEATRDGLRKTWLETWNDIPYDGSFHDECRKRLARCTPIATGPQRARRLTHTVNELTLVADPLEPDVVFVSLSNAMPSLLWNRCEPDALLDTLAPYLVDDAPRVGEFSRVVRTARALAGQPREVIERSVEYLELWLDDAYWCSAFDEDPWLGLDGPTNMLQQSAWLREVSQENPGRMPSISWRSLWSKSVLRVEEHTMGLFAFELRYEPAKDHEVIAVVNDITGGHLPTDVPTDLAASVLRGDPFDHVVLEDMKARGDSIIDRLAVLCALDPGETTTVEALRMAAIARADDPEVLGAVADFAGAYRHDALLFELAASQPDTELAANVRSFLAPQEPA